MTDRSVIARFLASAVARERARSESISLLARVIHGMEGEWQYVLPRGVQRCSDGSYIASATVGLSDGSEILLAVSPIQPTVHEEQLHLQV